MPAYYIWTIGCQMNRAESERIAGCLNSLGYEAVAAPQEADITVMNTCVVRKHAEDKVKSCLGHIKKLKQNRPRSLIAVTGCFVSTQREELYRHFPYIDLFFAPGAYSEFLAWLRNQGIATFDMDYPPQPYPITSTTFIPIIQGCNNSCSYCIVPYRRGREKSSPPEEIVTEATRLANQGTREITLLGQNVNSYGHDLKSKTDIAELLYQLSQLSGLSRLRFLTNHPKDMSLKLIKAMSSLPKVCPHICLPVQSGSDTMLKAMNRGYAASDYRRLVNLIRDYIPGVALSTDIIVGFPGETELDFAQTLELLEEIGFDVVHVAAYSPRPGTFAAQLPDDVPQEVKKRRLGQVESLQTRIATEITSGLAGKRVEVLVEGRKDGKWFGRTTTDKLVFFTHPGPCLGRLVNVRVNSTSPWSLQGEIVADSVEVQI